LYVTEHFACPDVAPGLRLQLAPLGRLPTPLVAKLTVPVGVIVTPGLLSLTVAVQVVEPFTATEEGKQLTLVGASRFVAFTVAAPLLGASVRSPA
jgi:hypothetical protein